MVGNRFDLLCRVDVKEMVGRLMWMLMRCCWTRKLRESFGRCLEGGAVWRKDEEDRVEWEDDGKVVEVVEEGKGELWDGE